MKEIKCLKCCSSSSAIREMQKQNSLRFHSTSVKMGAEPRNALRYQRRKGISREEDINRIQTMWREICGKWELLNVEPKGSQYSRMRETRGNYIIKDVLKRHNGSLLLYLLKITYNACMCICIHIWMWF